MPESDRPTARAELARRTGEYHDLTHRREAARLLLRSAINRATKAGISQVAIARITGYTREQVRRIVKACQKQEEDRAAIAGRQGLLHDD
jgi:hypothetical protein